MYAYACLSLSLYITMCTYTDENIYTYVDIFNLLKGLHTSYLAPFSWTSCIYTHTHTHTTVDMKPARQDVRYTHTHTHTAKRTVRTQIPSWALHRSASTLAAVHKATPLMTLHLIGSRTIEFPSCRCRLGFTPCPPSNKPTHGSLSWAGHEHCASEFVNGWL